MFLLEGEAKCLDVFERIVYNGVLSGISLSGDRFFYANPLASFGQHERTPWFGCACCPPNVALFCLRWDSMFMPPPSDFVNLYGANSAQVGFKGLKVRLEQQTRYPWEGEIKLTVNPEKEGRFVLLLRIPRLGAGTAGTR